MPEAKIRSEADIQREIAQRREDLAQALSHLGGVMRGKLDLRARARRRLQRSATDTKVALVRARSSVQHNPPPFLFAAGALLLLGVGLSWRRSRASGRAW